jgi:hypothetical protein
MMWAFLNGRRKLVGEEKSDGVADLVELRVPAAEACDPSPRG